MSWPAPPKTVLGVPVRRVVDTWIVEDIHGSRSYCLVRTADGRQVTLLRTDDGWHPTIVDVVDEELAA